MKYDIILNTLHKVEDCGPKYHAKYFLLLWQQPNTLMQKLARNIRCRLVQVMPLLTEDHILISASEVVHILQKLIR